jgi:hypothetical protein
VSTVRLAFSSHCRASAAVFFVATTVLAILLKATMADTRAGMRERADGSGRLRG